MLFRTFAFATAFSLTAALVQAAGLKSVEVPADGGGPAFKAFVWSPCAAEPVETKLGPIILKATRGCPVVGNALPLIVISHGHGGSSLGHHDTAETLANAGFIVAALNHPGDNFSDMSKSGDISAFIDRPTDIKRLVDFMINASPDAAKIDQQRIGFFGFSRGGYTGLVLAGAKPDFHDPSVICPDPAPMCGQMRRNEIPTRPLTQDSRIKAFVIADPLSFFPTEDTLKAVKAPLQLWGSQYGGDGVLPQSIKSLSENLPNRPEFQTVAGAGHFAFLAPCAAELVTSQPEICADASGFDRSDFHRSFDTQVLAFFKAQLNGAR
ncbi:MULTISPECIES: alpha/beta hydrolase family protein [unclassified Rhizobium]|uniref:alpha/beta hydrolase family protein n=1 Tax=unclassified Rhizobium TaxID=2613769 RepID=UPI00177C4A8F|nr:MULTISPECIES: alpha/beta fold hydrolase [unclassified Rhizobium]MBD8686365.1 alpha/beta hydrolase [Rhizobium sp. CFBP 13644]MBD8689962.1 alpha/beta hydrolase [Rhizobium sp. CFBP 13717]